MMSIRKRLVGASAAALLLAVSMPAAQAAGNDSDIFAGGGNGADRLLASEMADTEGRIVCGGACTVGALFVGSAALGYFIGRGIAN